MNETDDGLDSEDQSLIGMKSIVVYSLVGGMTFAVMAGLLLAAGGASIFGRRWSESEIPDTAPGQQAAPLNAEMTDHCLLAGPMQLPEIWVVATEHERGLLKSALAGDVLVSTLLREPHRTAWVVVAQSDSEMAAIEQSVAGQPPEGSARVVDVRGTLITCCATP